MIRARILAFAVACIMVAPQADAQGNRGNSNGVPGSIANIQAIVDAVRAQLTALLSSLPALTTLQADVSGLKVAVTNLTARLDALDARVGGLDSRLTAEVSTLNDTIAAAVAQFDASIGNVEMQLQGEISSLDARLDAVEDSLGSTLGDVSDLKTRVLALETAGGGGATVPVIWSGGCTSPVAGTGWVPYCANQVDDFSTPDTTHLAVSSPGLGQFQVNQAGLYRITFAATATGAQGSVRLELQRLHETGVFVKYLVQQALDTAGGSNPRSVSADLVWSFEEGDVFWISVQSGSSPAYSPWAPLVANFPGGPTPAASRLQIEYVGP